MMGTFADPFDALFSLQRALDSRLESDWLQGATAGMGAYPPINVFQQDHDLVAILELPGASMHRRERSSGVFDRTLTVPIRIDPERIKAEYRDGVLALFIPRAESDKPRTISIN